MIDLGAAMERFTFYLGYFDITDDTYNPLVVSSAEKIEKHLREKDGTKDTPLLIAAVAADAYYYHCLLEASRSESGITAGNVSVKNEWKNKIAAAKELRDGAFEAIKHLLRDDCFLVRGV